MMPALRWYPRLGQTPPRATRAWTISLSSILTFSPRLTHWHPRESTYAQRMLVPVSLHLRLRLRQFIGPGWLRSHCRREHRLGAPAQRGLAHVPPWPGPRGAQFRQGSDLSACVVAFPAWRRQRFGLSSYCPPSIAADGTLYVATTTGKLIALSSEGAVKWTTPAAGRCDGSPAIAADGTVVVSMKALHAIGPDGVERWAFTPPVDEMGGSPAIGPDGTIYAAMEDQGVYALRPRWLRKMALPNGKREQDVSRCWQ